VNFIERVMRVMTHINIGAAMGLAAWVLWSGWQVVTGHIAPGYTPDEVRTLVRLAHAGPPTPMELVPVDARDGAMPPCHEPWPAIRRADMALSGDDL
jgi:hypothetical protein